MKGICKYTAAHADEIIQLVTRVDNDTIRRAAVGQPAQVGVDFEMKPLPKPVDILVGAVPTSTILNKK